MRGNLQGGNLLTKFSLAPGGIPPNNILQTEQNTVTPKLLVVS